MNRSEAVEIKSSLETGKLTGLGAVGDAHRPQRLLGGGVEAARVRPVRRHHRVQRGAAGGEALGLGLVVAADQAHELAHAVP